MQHRILIIATHPDDEVLGCGGTIARYADHGDDVFVVVVTRGVPELFSPAVIEQTRRELALAHQRLGVSSVRFLDFPAPMLDTIPGYQLADRLKQVIQELGADTIFIPHRGDLHSDHRAVYMASLVAARPLEQSPVRRILCYETLSETEWASPEADQAFIPTVFIDISRYLTDKLAAMACYQTQLKTAPNPRSLSIIEALACMRGATVNLHAAEAFMLIRDIEHL